MDETVLFALVYHILTKIARVRTTFASWNFAKMQTQACKKSLIEQIRGILRKNAPTHSSSQIAVEVDGPSHFYVNSKRYTSYTTLKDRLLTSVGYKVVHIPYLEWNTLTSTQVKQKYLMDKINDV